MHKFTAGVFVLLTAFCLRGGEPASSPGWRLRLASPVDFQVVQRQTQTNGLVMLAGSLEPEGKPPAAPDKLEARFTGPSCAGALPATWQPLPYDPRVSGFRLRVPVPAGGWYRLEIRASRQGRELALAVVEHVGVGEVFVVVGQSNSANYGEELQRTQTGLVAAFDGAGWRLAADPQPGAGGSKGSFLPVFGDAIASRFQVPVGLVAMGVGATSVREWLPAGVPFTRLPTLTHHVVTVGSGQWEAKGELFNAFAARLKQFGPGGFRAVLWHQGESDAHQAQAERTLPGALYRDYLERLIRDSRQAIGWPAPWFVAQVSYHNAGDTQSDDLRAGQKALWDAAVALEGPDTDQLVGQLRESKGQGVHFSAQGLREHGRVWAEKVGPWLEGQLQAGR